MPQLDDICNQIRTVFNQKTALRDEALSKARELTRHSSLAIRAIHREDEAEANKELEAQLNSKAHYISLGGENIMKTSNEGIQSLYNLTLVLPGTKLTDPVF